MKRFILLTAILALGIQLNASSLRASLSYCTFYSPADGPYIETYLSFYAKSLVFLKQNNGKFMGNIGITIIFRQGEEVKEFKKYELKSPEVPDTSNLDFAFIDQQRFLLPNGDYEFSIQVSDFNTSQAPLTSTDKVTINFPADKISVSGIQLVEKYSPTSNSNILSKSGYDLVPYVDNFYPGKVNKLIYYSEIYQADKVFGENSKYLLSVMVKSNETGQVLPDMSKIRKETSKNVNVVFGEFDIQKLPSGNYNLVVEVRDQQNQIIAYNDLFFQRSNPELHLDMTALAGISIENSFAAKITHKDSLVEFIKSVEPISTEFERVFAQNQLKNSNIQVLQQFFLSFWEKRDPMRPEQAWETYKSEVAKVNVDFHTPIKKGYETDRGRVYLKYGPPNSIADQPFESSNSGMYIGDGRRDGDMGTVPYQIWHYYQLKNNLRDKKFVFANPSLATNDYMLIHSNVPGEVNNPNWQSELIRQVGIRDKDEMISPSGRFGNKSGDLYNMPH